MPTTSQRFQPGIGCRFVLFSIVFLLTSLLVSGCGAAGEGLELGLSVQFGADQDKPCTASSVSVISDIRGRSALNRSS